MRIIMGIMVALVLVGGLVWFMSGEDNSNTESDNNQESTDKEITVSSSIESDEDVFTEIDNALEGLG